MTLGCGGPSGIQPASRDAANASPYRSSGAALQTLFTDSALYSRFCEVPESGRPDYRKCLLKDQGLGRGNPPPPFVRP
jgi:hypothetical protein